MMLPFLVDLYKSNKTTFDYELFTVWGRKTSHFASPCDSNGTTANTASQLQIEYHPSDVLQDRIYFVALLESLADFTVTIGGAVVAGNTTVFPQDYSDTVALDVPGFYVGYADMVGSGDLTAQLVRRANGEVIMSVSSTLDTSCKDGITNYNIWAGFDTNIISPAKQLDITDYTYVVGFSNNAAFQDLCQFSCGRGYCPPGACSYALVGPSGPLADLPPAGTPGPGYAVENVDFSGLCGFACGKGYCPPEHCTSVSKAMPTPTISPFNPDACTGGAGLSAGGTLDALCKWACAYGYCPIAACSCSAQGPLNQPPPTIAPSVTAKFLPTPGVMAFDDLCRFTCARGFCPDGCSANIGCVSGTGTGGYTGLCDFSCGRGFCPPPCTCNAQGSAPTPTGYRPNVVGYGMPGLAADFDPLCNFTCNHGYCPTGVCGQDITVTATPDSGAFATITGLEPLAPTPTYVVGDVLEFPYPNDESMSVNAMILNTDGLDDIASFQCTDEPSVPDPDGEALGCIAEGTAWLFWAIYGAGGDGEITTPDADTNTRKRQSSSPSGHDFTYHDEWQPSGNYSTSQCMLLTNAPEGVWVPAGNGTTSRGVYHDLHFKRIGDIHVHMAYPGGYQPSGDGDGDGDSGNTTLASRQYSLIRPKEGFRFYRDNKAGAYGNGFFVQKPSTYAYDPYNFVGASVEKVVARSSSNDICLEMNSYDGLLDYGLMVLGGNANEHEAVTVALQDLQENCSAMSYYTGCSASSDVILDSGAPDDDDPDDPSSTLEEFDWELDCYLSGVIDSGDPDNAKLFPLEQRRKRSVPDYLELLDAELLDSPDVDYANATKSQIYALLEKRGSGRNQAVCQNPPGKKRKSVQAKFTSSRYNPVNTLSKLPKKIFGVDGRSCRAVLQTFSTIASIPKGMKLVAEHVFEIQFVKAFWQDMRDGLKPGGGAMSTGIMPWDPFDQSGTKATFFATWSSILANPPTGASSVSQSFYDALGTTTDSDNNLILDSLTNGLKATIWAGAANIVAPKKWTDMGHTNKLGTFNRIQAVFAYLNTAEGQAALSSTYGKLSNLCTDLTRALSVNNNLNYDTKAALLEFSRAHFDYMVFNTKEWITNKLADEATYWGSSQAAFQFGSANAQANLAQVQSLQSLSWLKITTTWLV